jgi:AcrR family transcriptional regulator
VPASQLRIADQERRRKSIRQATRQTIAEGGIEAATVRSIATTSGQSVATLYNLVGSRTEIFGAVLAELLTERMEATPIETGSDPIDQMRSSMKAAVKYTIRRKHLFAPLLVELGPHLGRDWAVEAHEASVARLTRLIELANAQNLLLSEPSANRLAVGITEGAFATDLAWAVGDVSDGRYAGACLDRATLVLLAAADGSVRRRLLQLLS